MREVLGMEKTKKKEQETAESLSFLRACERSRYGLSSRKSQRGPFFEITMKRNVFASSSIFLNCGCEEERGGGEDEEKNNKG